jgi:uncharacterized protein
MKVSVTVKTNSKVESIEKNQDGSYCVRVRVPPVEGKANERIRELLAEHFKKPKSAVQIVAGLKGKKKVFEIE